MAEDTTALFVKIAVEKGYLTAAQVDECRQAVEAAAQAGLKVSLLKAVQDRNPLSVKQAADIRREMRRRGVLRRIGGYELIEKLGAGAMGTVYKARQLSLGRVVALKVLKPELARDRKYLERFRREALLAAKLNHPNAVDVYDVGEDGGRPFIAMEYVEGQSVDKLLANGPLAEKDALAIVRGVAQALEAAHGQGIVHRDIKPSNILLTQDGRPKLTDLGIARQTGVEGMTLTATGGTLGTPQYMSPEQCRGERDIDGRSDIYSLGATLYHLVCGRPPYSGDTAQAIMHAHLYEPLPDPQVTNPAVSGPTAGVIMRMLAKDRAKRIQTCREVVRAVDAVAAANREWEAAYSALDAWAARERLNPQGEKLINAAAADVPGSVLGWTAGGNTAQLADRMKRRGIITRPLLASVAAVFGGIALLATAALLAGHASLGVRWILTAVGWLAIAAVVIPACDRVRKKGGAK